MNLNKNDSNKNKNQLNKDKLKGVVTFRDITNDEKKRRKRKYKY